MSGREVVESQQFFAVFQQAFCGPRIVCPKGLREQIERSMSACASALRQRVSERVWSGEINDGSVVHDGGAPWLDGLMPLTKSTPWMTSAS